VLGRQSGMTVTIIKLKNPASKTRSFLKILYLILKNQLWESLSFCQQFLEKQIKRLTNLPKRVPQKKTNSLSLKKTANK